jgi:hypothetical protein
MNLELRHVAVEAAICCCHMVLPYTHTYARMCTLHTTVAVLGELLVQQL